MRMFFRKARARQWDFAFEGHVAPVVLQSQGLDGRSLGGQLLARQAEIEEQLQQALGKALRAEVSIELEIGESALEWNGEIEALCEPGFGTQGLMGLRQLVGSTISRVLARHLPADLPRPVTRAVVTSTPVVERPPVEVDRSSKPLILLVLSTICVYLVALVVLGLIAMNLLGMAPASVDSSEPADAAHRSFSI